MPYIGFENQGITSNMQCENLEIKYNLQRSFSTLLAWRCKHNLSLEKVDSEHLKIRSKNAFDFHRWQMSKMSVEVGPPYLLQLQGVLEQCRFKQCGFNIVQLMFLSRFYSEISVLPRNSVIFGSQSSIDSNSMVLNSTNFHAIREPTVQSIDYRYILCIIFFQYQKCIIWDV